MANFFYDLESSNREQAVTSFLELSQLTRSFPKLKSEALPGNLTLEELEQCQANCLVPIWFNRQNASKVLRQIVLQSGDDLKDYSDGKLIYVISLAFAAKDQIQDRCLPELGRRSSTIVREWLPVILAYREIAASRPGAYVEKLQKKLNELAGTRRAAALYLLGRSWSILDEKHDDGILTLLQVPAEFEQTMPHLSAAALFEAAKMAQRAGQQTESDLLTEELRTSYPNSYHARLLQSK